jgi:hypothetical protein
MYWNNDMCWYTVASSGLRYYLVAGFCEHSNEHYDSTEG